MRKMIGELTFESLVRAIQAAHAHFSAQAVRAVNIGLTLRNWLIGCYIEEYERLGVDRAKYGDGLMDELAGALQKQKLPRCDRRELYRYRQFYLAYPQIVESVTPQLPSSLRGRQIRQLLSAQSGGRSRMPIKDSLTPQCRLPGCELLEKLSFTHLVELLQIEEPLKRAFYEIECIRGNWSVRELKCQISTLYFERSGLSKNKKKLAALIRKGAESDTPALAIRDPYVFEFLGIKPREIMGESHIEDALLDKLQDFLLELGRGFCFEARQKRIRIGDEFSLLT